MFDSDPWPKNNPDPPGSGSETLYLSTLRGSSAVPVIQAEGAEGLVVQDPALLTQALLLHPSLLLIKAKVIQRIE